MIYHYKDCGRHFWHDRGTTTGHDVALSSL